MTLSVPEDQLTGAGNQRAPFVSTMPTVRLLHDESSAHPFATTIAAAWSCYGAKPAKVENVLKLVHSSGPANQSAEAVADRADRRDRALRLYADLFSAGHHTTFQHANFTFVLDNVSRLAIWSFFHAHPHYNSEQVSQRYREVSGAVMTTPDLPSSQLELYSAAIEQSLEGYRRLTEILSVDALAGYTQVFPSRVKATGDEAEAKVASAVQKKAQEVARYVLPLATPAHLYHTVNGLTLLRYFVLSSQPDVPSEVRYIVQRMIEEVLAVDPYFLGAPGYPLNLRPLHEEETLESQMYARWHETVATARGRCRALLRRFRCPARPLAKQPPGRLEPGRRAAAGRCGPDRARRFRDAGRRRPRGSPERSRQPIPRPRALPRYELEADADAQPRPLHLPEADQRGRGRAKPAPPRHPRLPSGPAGASPPRARRDHAVGDRPQSGSARGLPADRAGALGCQERAPRRRRAGRDRALPPAQQPPGPLLRERHPDDLLLEVDQTTLLRRPARNLRDGGRGGCPGPRGLSRASATTSMAHPA